MIVFDTDALDNKPKRQAGSRTGKKIALCGSHSDSLHDAPWDDPTWEFWGHGSSRAYYKCPMDVYFDLHSPAVWTRGGKKGKTYPRWLAKNTTPIYMQERYPEVPASVKFPKDRILAEFGDSRPYFTNQVAWMIAMLMTEGVKAIGLFGVNYGVEAEYHRQRGSCEYWLGRAAERGIRIVLPRQCTLLAEPALLYGYESHDEVTGRLRDEYRAKKFNTIVPVGEGPPVPPKVFPKDIAQFFKEQDEDYPRPSWALGPLPHVIPSMDRSDGQASKEA